MTAPDGVVLTPLLILAAFTVFVMVMVGVRRSYKTASTLAFIGLAVSFISLWIVKGRLPRQVTPLLMLDRYAFFFIGLILAATMAVILLSYGYFKKIEGDHEELYVLLLLATLGASILAASNHFASFFLALELLSVSLYAMISYLYARPFSIEAGIKYLILAAVSAAFLLFGMALVYMAAGTMNFTGLMEAQRRGALSPELMVPGIALIVTGFGFKLALVPFHFWTPDVYQGAPAPVAAYIATVSKGAMFALLLRYFDTSGARAYAPISAIFWIIAIASMFTGNILALLQNNVKRILAYSSISHLGYLLVAFEAGGSVSRMAVVFYLVAYFITMLGAFGVVTVLSSGTQDSEDLKGYRGLFWRRPALAAVFTLMLLSLAGIPITAGFVGKFYIVAAGASSSLWPLLIILAVTSAIGLFYYLRVIVAMYGTPAEGAFPRTSMAPAGGVALALLTAALIVFGLFPGPLLDAIHSIIGELV